MMLPLAVLTTVALIMVVTDWRRLRAFRKVRRSSRAVGQSRQQRPKVIATTYPTMGRWARFMSLHPQMRELIYLPIPRCGAAAAAAIALALT